MKDNEGKSRLISPSLKRAGTVGAGGVVLTEHGPGIARPKGHPVGWDGVSVNILGKSYLLSPALQNTGELGWYREVAPRP